MQIVSLIVLPVRIDDAGSFFNVGRLAELDAPPANAVLPTGQRALVKSEPYRLDG